MVEDEAIAIDLESAQYLSINGSGVGLLDACERHDIPGDDRPPAGEVRR